MGEWLIFWVFGFVAGENPPEPPYPIPTVQCETINCAMTEDFCLDMADVLNENKEDGKFYVCVEKGFFQELMMAEG